MSERMNESCFLQLFHLLCKVLLLLMLIMVMLMTMAYKNWFSSIGSEREQFWENKMQELTFASFPAFSFLLPPLSHSPSFLSLPLSIYKMTTLVTPIKSFIKGPFPYKKISFLINRTRGAIVMS